MMTWLAGLTTKFWLVIIGALLAAVAGLSLAYYTRGVQITSLEADLKSCQADVAAEKTRVKQCEANNRVWEGKVNEQNEAIQKIKAEALTRAQESARLLARARAAAVTAETRARELEAKLAAPTPIGADAKRAVDEVRAGLTLPSGLDLE